MNPIVSIIIPIYNAENSLEACLTSCLRQTLENIELILVDDGSTDRSFSIAASYRNRFPDKIRLLQQKNSGPSAARNFGLQAATGTYIAFLDADDRVDRDMYLRLSRTAEKEEAGLVICGRYDIYTEQAGFHAIKRTPNLSHSGFSLFEAPELLSETTQFVWDKLFRRSIIETHALRFHKDFRYTEDVLFLCIYKYYCGKIVMIPDSLYYHYLDTRNPVKKYGRQLLDVPRVLEEIFRFYTQHDFFRHPDVFFDLTAKRFLFRVEHFSHMGGKYLQWKFCCRMFRVMKQYFPDWRKRIVHYHSHNFREGFSCLFRGNGFLMFFYIFTPNLIKKWFDRCPAVLNALRRKSKRILRSFSQKKKRYTDLFLNGYYRFWFDHGTIDPSLILIQSKGGREPVGNMLALLYESLHFDKKIILVLKKEYRDKWQTLCRQYQIPTQYVRTVRPNSYRYYRLLACSGYLLNDSAFSKRFIKRKGQIYLNTWHGIPLKYMGIDVPDRAYAIGDVQRNFLHADYLLFPNRFMQQTMLHAYMLDKLYPGTILQEGYPRTSILLNERRRSVIRQEQNLDHKRVCCYLPTWRGVMTKKENTKQYKDCAEFFQALDTRLDADTVFFVKLHPYAESGFQLGSYRNILPFPDNYETYDFLTACDVLITDYSSIFFDFAITGRKIILFAYDYTGYKKQRGLYLDPVDFPFPLVTTTEELCKEILAPKTYDDSNFLQTYCPTLSADTANRICRMLFQQEKCCHTESVISNSHPSPAVPGHFRLLYGGLLTPGADFNHLLYLLNANINEKTENLIAGIACGALKAYPERLKKLLSVSGFLSLEPDLFYTPIEVLAYVLLVKKHCKAKLLKRLLSPWLNRLLQREYQRNLGSLTFDTITICSKDLERHQLLLQTASNQNMSRE